MNDVKRLNAQQVATVLLLAGRPGDPELELRLLRFFQSDRYELTLLSVDGALQLSLGHPRATLDAPLAGLVA